MTRRGTSNTNDRGSAASRRERKRWLLGKFGDGESCKCSTCPTMLTFDTLTVDRHPVAGVDGGRYVRGNIRPQCALCASRQGAQMSHSRRKLRAPLVAVAALATAVALSACQPSSSSEGDAPQGGSSGLVLTPRGGVGIDLGGGMHVPLGGGGGVGFGGIPFG